MIDVQHFEWKQCLIVRADIKMSCGKMCAQVAHAAIAAFERAEAGARSSWLSEGQKKVVLKARDETLLYELKSIAELHDIPAALIEDAGLTELPAGTITALGLGPARCNALDKITSSIPLL